MRSQLYATNYLPSCIVRVYSIVMMSIALCAVLDSLPSVRGSLWITVRVSFRNCFSIYEIIQQLLTHRKYHSRKQEYEKYEKLVALTAQIDQIRRIHRTLCACKAGSEVQINQTVTTQ